MIAVDKEPMMDIAAVSEYLRISKSMIYKYVAKRKIPFLRVGNRIRFKAVEVDSWVASQGNKEAAE